MAENGKAGSHFAKDEAAADDIEKRAPKHAAKHAKNPDDVADVTVVRPAGEGSAPDDTAAYIALAQQALAETSADEVAPQEPVMPAASEPIEAPTEIPSGSAGVFGSVPELAAGAETAPTEETPVFESADSDAEDLAFASLGAVSETVVAPGAGAGTLGAGSDDPAAEGAGIGFITDVTVGSHDVYDSYPSAGKKANVGKRVAIIAGSVVGVLGVAYLAGAFVFFGRFFPNTRINGENVSFASVDEIAQAHSRATDGYALKLSGEGLDFSISGSELGLRIDGEGFAGWAHGQMNPWAWPVELFREHELSAEEVTTYDKEKLSEAVAAKVASFNEGATQPTNAGISYDEGQHHYQVTPESVGTALDADVVLEVAGEAVANLDREATIGDQALLQPTRTADDPALTEAVNKANATVAATQKLTIEGQEVYTVDSERIAGWVSLDENLQIQVNEDAIREWTQGELSQQLDTVGRTHSYTRPDGKQVTVQGGDYGWNLNGEELAHSLAEAIRSGAAGSFGIPMKTAAAKYAPGGQEWGSRYIDVDLAEQYVRMYDDGGNVIWESPCVSGNTLQGHGTPEGVYTMNPKSQGGVRLEGEDDPITGEPEYVSYVDYWMPFVNDAVALHDADWRYSFGGTIYQGNGSHGCVNLPVDKARELFGICQEGDVVITHW